MKNLSFSLFLLIMSLFTFNSFSQIGKDKWSITIDATLTSGVASKLYKNYLNGLVNTQPKLTYKVTDTWFVAAGPKYAYYTVSEFKLPIKTTGGLHSYGGFLEVGYQKWKTPFFGIEGGLKVGYAEHQFITALTRISGIQKVQAFYVNPCFSLILAADEATAYRWIIGYNIDAYNFKSSNIGIPLPTGYSAKEIAGSAQSIIVGFAFSYYFGNKRSDVNLD